MGLSDVAVARIEAAKRSLLVPDNPLMADLPTWVDWGRVGSQAGVVREIVDAFGNVDVVVLDAPTGSGKTLIAELVRRLMGTNAVYACSTIALQDQFVHDFPYSKVIKGRSNYRTLLDVEDVTCADCTFSGKKVGEDGEETWPCEWCGDKRGCPYEVAKMEAWASPLAVLNTRYLLTEGNGPGRFKGRGLVIADECDTLESELMGYVSVDISKYRARQLGLRAPSKVTVPGSWGDWFTETIGKVKERIAGLPGFKSASVKERREAKTLTSLAGSLQVIQRDTSGWVFTGDARKEEWGTISFKPVKVDGVAKEKLWRLGDKWLLMSATPISSYQMVKDDLGYDGDFLTVTMPSSFPVENRPIVIMPVANMSKKAQEDERGQMLPVIDRIVGQHLGENVLIHTVSYQLASWLIDELNELLPPNTNLWSYGSSGEKVAVVEEFKRLGGVLVAPSLDRGVDLPDDLCGVIVVAKVPFPNLGDRQVSARMHSPGGQVWYNVQAVRSLVQMTGRGVRHKGDRAVTYILDSQFDRIWNSGRHLFPGWWTDALQWRR